MTGDESRKLEIGDRVYWRDLRDQGTVSAIDWTGVTITWDSEDSTTLFHNDMAQVERAPMKL
jgi:hypothetical protein